MKKNIFIYVFIIFVAGLIGGYFLKQVLMPQSLISKIQSNTNSKNYGMGQGQNILPNRGNCLGDDCLLVPDLEYPVGKLKKEVIDTLYEAINDEYKALTTYEVVIAKFGAVRPFSMIKSSEEQHISSLKAIYDKYGLEVPKNTWSTKITIPTTLQESCQIGVKAEISNGKLYKDKLLPQVKDYEDITLVFTNLMNASNTKHLPAFERCSN